ncbi:glycoside hydrolase/deacetylase [Thozetella sp. PMI_491]|nr:glycoside hydrolase/deacetylase [Thozetella sp. PMI_491]
MSHHVTGRRILISGAPSARMAALHGELTIHAQIGTALRTLDNKVDLHVVDMRTCEPCGRDPIWEVPISEWNQQIDAGLMCQQKMLLQVKSFLQHRYQLHKSNGLFPPFAIVVLGHQDLFDGGLDPVIRKLQRDVSWLHRKATVSFLDVEALAGEATEQSIASAIGILLSTKTGNGIVSMNSVWSLRSVVESDESAAELIGANESAQHGLQTRLYPVISPQRPKAKIALSFDYDALSAFLGTGAHPENNLSDYSTGVFSGRVGGRRLLRMLQKYGVADKVTWFIPGHTMETFESTIKEIVASGAEIALHGYAHEGAYQMTPEQERDVLVKCMEVSERFTGKKVQGWRAPMYQLRETTIELLKELGFLYDSSLSHHDSQPYFTPSDPPIEQIDFSKPASSWLRPTPLSAMDTPVGHPLVEIPIGWNNEDMMALQYFPHVTNTNGQVDARVVEQRWKDIFLWHWENAEAESDDGSFIFPLLMHPDTSGMAHVMAMADRFVAWLRGWGDSVEFHTYESIARDYLQSKGEVMSKDSVN